MDNDIPWNLPEPQQRPQIPKTSPQVPDVTLFSPTNKPSNKPNFLQRAIANEKIFSNSNKHIELTAPSSYAYNKELFSKPSVPDLSLLHPQVLKSTDRINEPTIPMSSKNGRTSQENVFGTVGKPSVPDVTILEEEPKLRVNPSELIFGESYKKQLLNSHEQFMKQIRTDPEPLPPPVIGKKISPLFKPQPKYQENPLRKYAPTKQPVLTDKDGNSSSILVDTDDVIQPSSLDKSDEMTFKKVAEMLCEIQKLVIPGKTLEQTSQGDNTPTSSSQQCAVLKKLASTYLSTEEFELYDVEKELKEIEGNS